MLLTQLAHRVPVLFKSLLDRKLNAPEQLIQEHMIYPACESHEATRALGLESREEHRQVKTLLKNLNALPVDSEHFEARSQLRGHQKHTHRTKKAAA